LTGTWDEEDEYVDIEAVANGFGALKQATDRTLPDGVVERISAHAERTGKTSDKVTKDYLEYIKKEFDCGDWTVEDEDLLIDWAESMFVQTRRQGGSTSSANLSQWVGCFVGVADKTRDVNEGLVRWNLTKYDEDPEGAIGSGRLGKWEKDGDEWTLLTKDGSRQFSEPLHAIKHKGEWLSMLSMRGDPQPAVVMGRVYYFLGGEEGKFVNDNDISLYQVTLKSELKDLHVNIGQPCRIPVKPPKEDSNYQDRLETYQSFEIEYTDTFLPQESLRHLLQPMNLWTKPDFHDLYVPIASLEEAYESGKQSRGDMTWGPLVFTKGTVVRLNTEPRDSEYDEMGFNYYMTVSSTLHGDIDVRIPGATGELTTPFHAGWGEGAFPYAENSTVLLFGRLGLKVRDGLTQPTIRCYGAYADPRRARRRPTGGETGLGQFN
jgi:hypothetical protein